MPATPPVRMDPHDDDLPDVAVFNGVGACARLFSAGDRTCSADPVPATKTACYATRSGPNPSSEGPDKGDLGGCLVFDRVTGRTTTAYGIVDSYGFGGWVDGESNRRFVPADGRQRGHAPSDGRPGSVALRAFPIRGRRGSHGVEDPGPNDSRCFPSASRSRAAAAVVSTPAPARSTSPAPPPPAARCQPGTTATMTWSSPSATTASRPSPWWWRSTAGEATGVAAARTTCPTGGVGEPEYLHELGRRKGFAVVYPDGVPGKGLLKESRSWNAGGGVGDWRCTGGRACEEDRDDVRYVRAMLDDVARRVAVDPDRIYATGLSNGGAISHRLA